MEYTLVRSRPSVRVACPRPIPPDPRHDAAPLRRTIWGTSPAPNRIAPLTPAFLHLADGLSSFLLEERLQVRLKIFLRPCLRPGTACTSHSWASKSCASLEANCMEECFYR